MTHLTATGCESDTTRKLLCYLIIVCLGRRFIPSVWEAMMFSIPHQRGDGGDDMEELALLFVDYSVCFLF